jgi:DNA-binding XRE family transcriptional regulator
MYPYGEVIVMTAKQLIEMACAYAGMSKADLARNLGWSPQTLSNRLNTEKFTVEEWKKIGEALGATAHITFTFPDGKEIK